MCACAIDVGTCFLVSAKQDTDNKIKIKSIRDSFLDLENDAQVKAMLKLSQTDFIEAGDKIYIIGNPSVVLANIFNKNPRRPMSKGVLAPGELEAEKILAVLMEGVLGKSQSSTKEICFYSVPAPSIDQEMDIIFHGAVLSKILENLNYKPVSLNEAAAVSYSNAAKENFSSLSISWGSGMTNVCLMYQTVIGMAFSISRGGDWIDISSSRNLGATASRLQSVKEQGIDLMDASKGVDSKTIREREALTVYYKSLVLYALDSIKREFIKRAGTINLPAPVPIILSGGTALAGNFLEFFKQGLSSIKDWPVPYSEVRMASDPLNAPAQGLLVAAMNYEEAHRGK